MFSGLGDALTIWDKQKKQQEDTGLENAVSDIVNQSADPSLFTAPSKGESRDRQDPIVQAGGDLSRLKQAATSGSLSELAYTTRVDARLKRLKVQYPDRIAEIDKLYNQLSNSSSANDVRKALLQEQAAEQQNASAAEKEKAATLKSFPEILDPRDGADLRAQYEAVTGNKFDPNNFSVNGLLAVKGTRDNEKATLEIIKQKAAVAEIGSKQREEGMYKAAVTQATQLRSKFLSGVLNTDEKIPGTNTSMRDIQQRMSSAMSDGKLDPEEQKGLLLAVQQAKLGVNQLADELINGTSADGISYGMELKSEESKNSIRKILTDPVDLIEQSIAGKNADLSMINMINLDNKATKEYSENDLLKSKKGDFVDQMTRLNTTYPEYAKALREAQQRVATKDVNMTSLDVAMANRLALYMSNQMSITDLFRTYEDELKSNPKAALSSLEVISQSMASPEVPQEQAASKALEVYTKKETDLVRDYGGSSPTKLFNILVNPAMTAKLKGTKAWGAYSKFATDQAIGVLESAAKNIKNEQMSNRLVDVTYDEKTHRFIIAPSGIKGAISSGLNPMHSLDQIGAVRAASSVGEFNVYLNTIEPILQENGVKTEDFIGMVFGTPDFANIEKQGGFIERMAKSFGNWITQQGTLDRKGQVEPMPKWGKDSEEFMLGPSSKIEGDSGAKANKIAKQLARDFGISPEAASGFVGNLFHESGGFKQLQELNPTVKGSKGGFGWAQWTGPRRKAYMAYAKANGLDPSSDEANYGFLKEELMNSESKTIQALQGVNDPAEAAQIAMQTFVRPGIPHLRSRVKHALAIADHLD